MSEKGKFAVFLSVALTLWAVMHFYVFARVASVPWVETHVSGGVLFGVAAALWASYPTARILSARGWKVRALEFAAANWIGILFLLLAVLFVTDVVTGGGWLFPNATPALRGWAVVLGSGLSAIALVQGLRPPVVRNYEVRLAGLPKERDGMVFVAVSDLHLGTLIGERWLERLVHRVNAMKPDLVAVVGDLVDGDVKHAEQLLPTLRKLRAPLGVWAVTGNHEYYAGAEPSVRLLETAGYKVLRDSWAEVSSGLVLAGVDDLTAREELRASEQHIEKALTNRPHGATILLSHSPMNPEKSSASGVGLMLSGHTHNGQIWPFNFLVRLRYALIGGRYEIGGMTAIVCRGTGTWGPRMRLWHPCEFLRIMLRAKD